MGSFVSQLLGNAAMYLRPSQLKRYSDTALFRGVVWSGFGSSVFQALSLVASVIAGRVLGPHGFGFYGVAQATVMTATAFVGPAMSLAAATFVSERRSRSRAEIVRLTSTLWIATVSAAVLVSAALVITAPWIAVRSFSEPALTTPLRLAGISVLFALLAATQVGFLIGFAAFRGMAMVNVFRGIAFLLATAGLASYWGVTGALYAIVLVNALWCIGNHLELRRQFAPTFRELFGSLDPSLVRSILRFGVPAILQGVSAPGAIWLSNVIVSRTAEGFYQLGIFNAANLWRYAILFVPLATAQPLVAYLGKAKEEGNVTRYRRVFAAGVALGVLAAIASAVVILLGRPLILAAYGPAFGATSQVLPLVAGGAVMSAVGICGSALIYTLDSMWVGVMLNLGWSLLFVGAVWALVGFGAGGLAGAYAIASGVQAIAIAGFCIVMLRRLPTIIMRANIGASV